MTLALIALAAGLLTVLAPCVLPLLPVIVGGSLEGDRSFRRATVLVLSLGASVFAFTLLLKVSTLFIAVPQLFWQVVSGGLLVVFGLVTLFPGLWDSLPVVGMLNRASNRALGQGYMRKDVWGEVVMGAALGPVFSSCSPTYFLLLATVLPANPAAGVVYLALYCVGLMAALLGVAVVGQRVATSLGAASDPRGWFKRGIGVVFVVIGIAVISGVDKTSEQWLLDHAGFLDVTKVEQQLLGAQNSTATTTPVVAAAQAKTQVHVLSAQEKAALYPQVPELAGISAYINTPIGPDGKAQPITLASLRGKVVLIDFWTYSCINCLRTLPYEKELYAKYKDQGLVIIGVHTPEFAFEHVESNVRDAVQRLGITYPVVLDNDYKTWSAFSNQYWPREYLVDVDGYVVYDHAGEGDYDKTEMAVQAALAERAARMGTTSAPMPAVSAAQGPDLSGIGSPETYFGSNRNEYLGNGTQGAAGVQTFTLPATPNLNTLYLNGTWDIEPEYAQAQAVGADAGGSSIEYYYSAGNVYFVASASTPVQVEVLLDGKPVGQWGGDDVDKTTSTVTIGAERLYSLVHTPGPGAHVLELKVMGAGLKAYTFTFG